MKKFLFFVATMLCCAMTIFAQNDKISYQAVVRDTENKLVANKPVIVTVNIFNGNSTQAAYTETHSGPEVKTNLNGLISLLVGTGTVTGGSWGSIDWKAARIETTVTLNGVLLGTLEMPLTAVPYALYTEELDPNALVLQQLYNVISADSALLQDHIDTTSAHIRSILQNHQQVIDDLEALEQMVITGDASSIENIEQLLAAMVVVENSVQTLRDSVKTNITNIAANAAKEQADSAYLKGLIDGNAAKINTLATKEQADSALLGGRLDAIESAGYITTDVNNLTYYTTTTDLQNTYATKTEVTNNVDSVKGNLRNEIATKANTSYVNEQLALKANSSDVYTKSETYNKTEVNTLINGVNGGVSTLRDSVKTNIQNIETNAQNITALKNRVNFFNTHICDSVMACEGIQTMRDSIQTVNDRITMDSTILANRITTDSTILANRITTDSTILANRITTDSTALVNRIVTDSTALHKAIKDTANAIRGDLNTLATTVGNITVNDPAITLKNGSTNLGSFTLNQASASEIDLSSLTPDLSNYATLSGNNTYTGTNDFTDGTTKVASGFTMGTTTTANCGNVAVNACDLLAVFDSLSNRIQGVFDSLKHLNDSLANELEALKNTIPPTADAPTIKNLTSTSLTVKANNTSSGAAITSYEYCYSTNSDMSGATCQTSALDTIDLIGLTPNTDYYVTVKATNFAGSTTSSTTTARTPAHAPTATVNTPTSVPTGFKVEVTDIDPKEKDDATTVQVCYVLKGSGDCPEKESADYAECKTVDATGIADTAISVTGLTPSTGYCAIVKVSNGDSTTIYGPYTVTTGEDITMTVSQTGGGIISLCGASSVPVTYTATPSDGGSYTYSWSGTPASKSDNTATYSYTSASTYNVTVTATHTTEGYTVTATATTTVGNSGGPAVTMGLCDNYLTVTVKSVSGNPKVSWGDGDTSKSVTASTMNPTSHTYSTSGTYTITAFNSSGCTATYTMALAEAAHTSCNLSQMTPSSLLSNERGSSTAIDSVSDHEGNWYEVVQIGTQCWLKENLRTTTSPKTGTNLVNTAGYTSNSNSSSQLYGSKVAHWYNNASNTYAPKGNGLLYNWCAAMDTANPSSYVEVPTSSTSNDISFDFNPSGNHRGICPEGWHLPTDAEWNTMDSTVSGSDWQASYKTFVGFRGSHAGKLSTGCNWEKNMTSNTANSPGNYSNVERNSSGFAAVPTGYFLSTFNYAVNRAYFWSSSQTSSTNAWYRYLQSSNAGVYRHHYGKNYGLSVRCLRD